jgi:hypothetical protein
MVNRISKSLSVYLLFLGTTLHGWTQCPPVARQAVKQFFDYDLDGYRLTSERHEAIWKLTQQNGEPPDAPVTVTIGYDLIGETPSHGGCIFRVQTRIFGFVIERDDGLKFSKAERSIEVWRVPVMCSESSCKIDISFSSFKVPPHPNKDAAEIWLAQLERIRNTPQEKSRIHQLLETVQSLH